MAEEPDGGLVHETPVDPAVQLKALVEHVKAAQSHHAGRSESRRRVETQEVKQRRETYIEPVVPAQLDLVIFFPLIDLFMVPVWNTSISCEKLR